MPMHPPLVLDPEASVLLNEVVELAFRDAKKRNMIHCRNAQEALAIFARRIIPAIECGERDIEKLKNLALSAEVDQVAA